MEKQRTRLAKAQCNERMADLQHRTMDQEDEKSKLLANIETLAKENADLKQQIAEVNKGRYNDSKQHERDIAAQQKFALAGNNEALRLKERLATFDDHVRSMNVRARVFFKPDDHEKIRQDPDNVMISVLQKNFDKVMTRLHELEVIRENMKREKSRQTRAILELLHWKDHVTKPEDALKKHLDLEYNDLLLAKRQAMRLAKNIHSVLNDVTVKSPKNLRENATNFSFENNKRRKSVDVETNDIAQLKKQLNLMYADVDLVKSEFKSKDQEILALQNDMEQLRLGKKNGMTRKQSLTHITPIQTHNQIYNSSPPAHLEPIPDHLTNGHHTPPGADDSDVRAPAENISPSDDVLPRSNDQVGKNISLPPISPGCVKTNHMIHNTNGEQVLKNRKSLDPLDSFRSPRPDSPDPRSLSRTSTRSDSSTQGQQSLVQTVQLPKDWSTV